MSNVSKDSRDNGDVMIDLEDFENVLGPDDMRYMMIRGEITFMKLSGDFFTDLCQKYLADKLEELINSSGNLVFHDSFELKLVYVGLGDSPDDICKDDAKKYFGGSWGQTLRTMKKGMVKVEMNVKTAIAMERAGFRVMYTDVR